MSFWVLNYWKPDDTDCPGDSGTRGIYKTQDDAIMAAINTGFGELRKTPDQTIWYCSLSESKVPRAIKLVNLKERVKETGTFNPFNPWTAWSPLTPFYTISEAKLREAPEIEPKQVKEVAESGFEELESSSNSDVTEKKLIVKRYPNENGGLYIDTLTSVIYTQRGDRVVAIGSDAKNDGKLKFLTPIQLKQLTKLGVETSQAWRNGNNEPILYAEYVKMSQQKD